MSENPFRLPTTRRAYEAGRNWAETSERRIGAHEAAAVLGYPIEPERNAFVTGALAVLEKAQ